MGRLGDHPHIVTVYDIGEEAGRPYIVSQYMAGGDVEHLLAQSENRRLSVDEALRVTKQICEALAHAHERGVIHRDLKPRNIWLTEGGTAKLGDFGLAVALDRSRLSVDGVMVGTVAYMPPEQVTGRDPGPAADLYSLGCVLYEMVTSRAPFSGEDTVSVISQHLNTPPLTPAWHNAEISPALEQLIMQLLSKAPEERPASALAVLDRLEQISSRPEETAARHPVTTAIGRLTWVQFVGRQQELATLRNAVDLALGGQSALVLIAGQLGIGKTRLAEEAAVYARLRGFQVLTGRCYETEAALPYAPFVETLRQHIAAHPADVLRREVGEGVSDVAKLVPEIRQQVPDAPHAGQADPDHERYRLLESVSSFLLNSSRDEPLLIALDNLQWADKPSLLLLQHLARRLKGNRVLVVATYRDTDLEPGDVLSRALGELRRERLYERLVLRGLSSNEVLELLEAAAQQELDDRGRTFAHRLQAQTEGNPFFIEEIMRHLVETGRTFHRDGRWQSDVAHMWELGIPEGVRDVVGGRLGLLSEACLNVLTHASILGREFDYEVLGRMMDVDEDTLVVAVEEALAAHVVAEVPAPMPTYAFTHQLLRQTLYEEISLPRRQRLHLRAARAIESAASRNLGPHIAQLAMHYRHAGSAARAEADKAIDYTMQAGSAAVRVFAYEKTAAYWERALELMEERGSEPRDQATLLEQLGDLMYTLGDHRKGEEYLKRALKHYEELGEGERMAQTYSRMGRDLSTFPHNMDIERALAHFRAAEAILSPGPERSPLGYLYAGVASGALYGGRTEEGVSAARRAIEIAENLGNETLRANAGALLGFHLAAGGNLEEGMELVERAWEAGDRMDKVFVCFVAAWIRGIMAFFMRAPREAIASYEKELSRDRLAQAPMLRAVLLNHLGQAQALAGDVAGARRALEQATVAELGGGAYLEPQLAFRDGDWERAEEIWNEVRDRHRRTGNRMDVEGADYWLGQIYASRGDTRRAEEMLTEGLELAQSGPHLILEVGFLVELSSLYAESGKLEEARASIARAIEIQSNGEDWRGLTGGVALAQATVAAAEGRDGAAQALFATAAETARRYGVPWDEAKTLLRWARYLMDSGDRRAALEKLDAALELYQAAGAGAAWLEPLLAMKLEAQGVSSSDMQNSIAVVAWSVQSEKPDLRPHASPDGTVTVLFTDIEGSSALTERLGDKRWWELLQVHNSIVREQIDAHRGYEVKSQGDGFMVAFSSAHRAGHCAIGIQRAFAARNREHDAGEALQVRIGMHTGEVIKEADDFFGKNVVLAARIGSEACGGEILASSLVKALTESSGDIDFGAPRTLELKGLAGNHSVYPVLWSGNGYS